MSYLSLAKRMQAETTGENTPLALADCAAMVAETFARIESEYIEGALAMLDSDSELTRSFNETEAAIYRAVKAGPTTTTLRVALDAHIAVIRECVARHRARQERLCTR